MTKLIWLGFIALYVWGSFNFGWNENWVSLLVVPIALFAFLDFFKFDEAKNDCHIWAKVAREYTRNTELMAIFLLLPIVFFIGYYVSKAGGHEGLPHIHAPWEIMLTIVGIMFTARNAMTEILGNINRIEYVIGKYPTLILMNIAASLTGEPGASKIQSVYIGPRLPDDQKIRDKVAVGLATGIGTGGGLTNSAPPAVLMIWPVLVASAGWSLITLWMGLGVFVLAHVIVAVAVYGKHIQPCHASVDNIQGDYNQAWWALPIFLLTVMAHIAVSFKVGGEIGKVIVYSADVIFALICILQATIAQQGKTFSFHTWEDDIQPVLIAGLLFAIDNIGLLAEPGIIWLGGVLPIDWIPREYLPLGLAMMMFVVTGVTSALADNALATKVFIPLPFVIGAKLLDAGMPIEEVSLIVHAMIIGIVGGALSWGWITVQGNLPNFPLKKAFSVEAVIWVATGLRYYVWPLVFATLVMAIWIQFFVPILFAGMLIDFSSIKPPQL
jgi:hypothetical protein